MSSITLQSHLFLRFEAIATKDSAKIAIVENKAGVSYGDILERANSLADMLAQSGVKPGSFVAVILPNSADFIVAAFAIWRCGAILVPLHVRFQEDEILRYVADCQIHTIITNARLNATAQTILAKDSNLNHLWVFTSDSTLCKYAGRHQAPATDVIPPSALSELDPDAPALSQYSTGSTGFSKRITRTHRQLTGEFDTVSALLEITSHDRILGAAPFFHSYGLSNVVLASMLSGATLYATGDFFPKDILKLIEAERLTGFPGVPFMYQLLVDIRATADLSSIRYALAAGAPLPAATAHAFQAQYQVGIRQLYGSTETGVISIEPVAVSNGQEPTAGMPIPGVAVQIMDEEQQAVRIGLEGQVAVTSPYAATRYENLKGKSESFFANGLFFPGDLGRMQTDGKFTLCGRKRQFINVAGNKVDPTDIENVLRTHPAIKEVVVLGIPDGAASEKIKAVLVASAKCSRLDILEHCKQLAEFKRPRVIEFRQEIPRSPLGKILRKYLIEDYEKTKAKHRFDPHTGFLPSTQETNGQKPELDFSSLPPFLRVLLVTDGTVTKMLEAYLWEPIEVELLHHALEVSHHENVFIGVQANDPVLKRRIALRGSITGSIYAFAETVILNKQFPEELIRNLIEKQKGIGELLRQQKAETFRELISVEQSQAGPLAAHLAADASEPIVSRTYRISYDGKPAIWILEAFPISRFRALT